MSFVRKILIWVFVLSGFFSGCASVQTRTVPDIEAVPSVEGLFRDYFQKGQEYERAGDLPEALHAFKIAGALDPLNQDLIESRRRVETALQKKADDHYNIGLKLKKEGKYGEARKHFLATIRFRPEHPGAKETLLARKRIRINRYIVHTVKEGESLSMLAGHYYGTTLNFPTIAKYNNLTDAAKIFAGQKIKIPVVEGMVIPVDDKSMETERPETSIVESWDWEWGSETRYQASPSRGPDDQVAYYRDHGMELFGDHKYHEAIVEFQKVLYENPEDETALDYCHRSHLQLGISLFEAGEYLGARQNLETALKYNRNCPQCRQYIVESEERYKELHYKKGMECYGKEQLLEAINEWEFVRNIDPKYKRVDYLIHKAKTILKNLEELKEKRDQL